MSANEALPQDVYVQAVELQNMIDTKFAEADQLRAEGADAVQQLLNLIAPYQTRNIFNPFGQGGGTMIQGGGGFPGGGGGFPGIPGPGYQGGGQQGGGQHGGGSAQAPTSPPPAHIPPKPFSAAGAPGLYAVDPGSMRRCLFNFTYVWLTNGDQFWFFPIFLGPTSVAGFRWVPQLFSWRYFGIDLRRIDSFTC